MLIQMLMLFACMYIHAVQICVCLCSSACCWYCVLLRILSIGIADVLLNQDVDKHLGSLLAK